MKHIHILTINPDAHMAVISLLRNAGYRVTISPKSVEADYTIYPELSESYNNSQLQMLNDTLAQATKSLVESQIL